MAFQITGTLIIDNLDILITKWRVALIDPAFHLEMDSQIITSDGSNPVDWTLTGYDANCGYVVMEPLIDRIWSPQGEMGMGSMVIPDDPDNAFLYEVTAGDGYWVTGQEPPVWPTTPGQTVTDGDLTFTCIGQRVQPQIEGPVWGNPPPG